jgi:hypothetical protein
MALPVLIAAAVAVAVAGVSLALTSDARTRRALKRRPIVPVGSVRAGQIVRVRGRLVALDELLQAPLSQRKCAYYLATAEERRSSGTTSVWREVAREEHYVDFAVDDGSGRVRIRMSVPRVAVVRDLNTRSGTFDDANAAEDGFVRRHGLKSVNAFGLNIALRYCEGALEPGEQVTVLGMARHVDIDGERVLVIDAPDDGPLLLSDDPRAVQG